MAPVDLLKELTRQADSAYVVVQSVREALHRVDEEFSPRENPNLFSKEAQLLACVNLQAPLYLSRIGFVGHFAPPRIRPEVLANDFNNRMKELEKEADKAGLCGSILTYYIQDHGASKVETDNFWKACGLKSATIVAPTYRTIGILAEKAQDLVHRVEGRWFFEDGMRAETTDLSPAQERQMERATVVSGKRVSTIPHTKYDEEAKGTWRAIKDPGLHRELFVDLLQGFEGEIKPVFTFLILYVTLAHEVHRYLKERKYLEGETTMRRSSTHASAYEPLRRRTMQAGRIWRCMD